MLTSAQLANILRDGANASRCGAECFDRLSATIATDPFQIPGLLADGRACDVSLAMLVALLERRIQADLAMIMAMKNLQDAVLSVGGES